MLRLRGIMNPFSPDSSLRDVRNPDDRVPLRRIGARQVEQHLEDIVRSGRNPFRRDAAVTATTGRNMAAGERTQ